MFVLAGPDPGADLGPAVCIVFLTAARRLFSFFWRVDNPEQISSSMAPPC